MPQVQQGTKHMLNSGKKAVAQCGKFWTPSKRSLSLMLFPKTQNPTESDKVNMVVSTIHHPMYLITGLILEVV
jgi:hypothetical protein